MMSQVDFEKLRKIMPKFKEFYEKSEDATTWLAERQEKDVFVKKYFAQDAIDRSDEGVLRDLIRVPWAFNGWTNKDKKAGMCRARALAKFY
jgi:hypothetical protein